MRPNHRHQRTLALALALCAWVGCTNPPPGANAVPTYTAPPAPLFGSSARPGGSSRVTIHPAELIAPVGTEVVLRASVCSNGYLMANQRVEWTLSQESVGQFGSAGDNGFVDRLLNPVNTPQKISSSFVTGVTSSQTFTLSRGTPGAEDDVTVRRGEAWVTASSQTDGVSFVTVMAPDLAEWSTRQQTATIHWVDAQWILPPPSTNPVGTSDVLTTSVLKQTSNSPLSGWAVRYEVAGGPPAGFAPDGQQAVEIPTDALGQASVQLVQQQPAQGTNEVRIQIIRPADASGRRLIVGSGSTQRTWTSDVSMQVTGPTQANVGDTLTYRIAITNPGGAAVREAVATAQPPEGLEYVGGDPAAETTSAGLVWRLGEIAANSSRTVEAKFRAVSAGNANFCAALDTAAGALAQQCAATVVQGPQLRVDMTGPETAEVGGDVSFEITVTNVGSVKATGLLIQDFFDEGLKHSVAESPIERDLNELAPGQSSTIAVTLRVERAGKLGNRVVVTGDAGVKAEASKYVNAGAESPSPAQPQAAQPLPGAASPSPTQPAQPPAAQPEIVVRHTGPAAGEVGQEVTFRIEVRNSGAAPLKTISVVDTLDKALSPKSATANHNYDASRNELSWTIDQLLPGQALALELVCRCQAETPRACSRAVVTAASGATDAMDACLKITAPERSLTLKVVDLKDPVTVGGDVTYVISVSNDGKLPQTYLEVEATAPLGASLQQVGTKGPTKARFDVRTVNFDPFPELKTGETIRYYVVVRAEKVGQIEFNVDVKANGLTAPLSDTTKTDVIPAQ